MASDGTVARAVIIAKNFIVEKNVGAGVVLLEVLCLWLRGVLCVLFGPVKIQL